MMTRARRRPPESRHLHRAIAAALLAAAASGAWALPGRAQPPAPFTFGVAGDFTLENNFKATVSKVKETKQELLLALGDLSYKSDGEQEWCGEWAKAPAFKNVMLVAGNHDTDEDPGGDIADYVQYCGTPSGVSIQGQYGLQYYFDYPPAAPLARFIMLIPGIGGNTGLDTNYKAGSQGYKFTAAAIDDARARAITWIFVGMHKNYISTMRKTNEISTDSTRTFMTMLLNKRVDVVFQGHEHGYERSKQLATSAANCPIVPTNTFNSGCVADSDDVLVKGAGTVIHVLGTGGKDMRELELGDSERPYFIDRFAYSGNESFGFGSFTVTATRLTYSFVRSAGAAFADTFTITAPGS
jgi:3',5'-cyclic AMP phosphodiesterase CpdA